MTAPKQICPECGQQVTTIRHKQANYRQETRQAKAPLSRHVSTTYTFACVCGKVFTRVIPVK